LIDIVVCLNTRSAVGKNLCGVDRLNNVLGKMFDGSTDTQGINFAWEPNYLMFLTELSVTIQRRRWAAEGVSWIRSPLEQGHQGLGT
jgi:hypothetical protein